MGSSTTNLLTVLLVADVMRRSGDLWGWWLPAGDVTVEKYWLGAVWIGGGSSSKET
jgi:hypothetical protein